jgi:hypothetical protein
VSDRLASGLIVSALLRRVSNAGGFAAVLAKGDPDAGAILIVTAERGSISGIFERILSANGSYRWVAAIVDLEQADAFIARRRTGDPDIWIIELDIPEADRFIDTLSGLS